MRRKNEAGYAFTDLDLGNWSNIQALHHFVGLVERGEAVEVEIIARGSSGREQRLNGDWLVYAMKKDLQDKKAA